jgi:hypothetical protein
MAQQQQAPRSQKPKPKAAAPVKTNKPAAKPGLSAQARKEAELMKKYPGGVLVKNPVRDTLQSNVGGKAPQLEEVLVKGEKYRKPKDTTSTSKFPLPKLKAPAVAPPKTMGRLRTAVSDATSSVRGAANLAFGKNQSQTTGGKILERGARLATAGLGMTAAGVPGSAANYGTKIANATNKATGYIKKGTKAAASGALKSAGLVAGAAGVAIPVIKGQMNFKNRTEESKKRGIMNPGKGKANLGKINFDKPFQKKTAASDSSSRSKKK